MATLDLTALENAKAENLKSRTLTDYGQVRNTLGWATTEAEEMTGKFQPVKTLLFSAVDPDDLGLTAFSLDYGTIVFEAIVLDGEFLYRADSTEETLQLIETRLKAGDSIADILRDLEFTDEC